MKHIIECTLWTLAMLCLVTAFMHGVAKEQEYRAAIWDERNQAVNEAYEHGRDEALIAMGKAND